MTLRTGTLVFLSLLFVVALVLQVGSGTVGWLPIGCYAAILILLIAFEFHRYRPAVDRAAGLWQATDEKFEDPTTGKRLQVYVNAQTGERDYRPLEKKCDDSGAVAGWSTF